MSTTYHPRLPAVVRPAVLAEIARYERPVQKRLSQLARSNPRVAQLIEACPAAAHAIATERGGPDACAGALKLVKDGAGAKKVLRAQNLPVWMRKLPPEALVGPIGAFPSDDGKLDRTFANAAPSAAGSARAWFFHVRETLAAADLEAAAWMANQFCFAQPWTAPISVTPLAAYIWMSRDRRGAPLRAHASVLWHPKMQVASALLEMREWVHRATKAAAVRPKSKRANRNRASKKKTFEFVELVSAQALVEEGLAMNHCSGTYASWVALGRCKLFGVRFAGARVATVEIKPPARAGGPVRIGQLYGPANSAAPMAAVCATKAWATALPSDLFEQSERLPEVQPASRRWRVVFGPYLEAKGPQRGFPAKPDAASMSMLASDVAALMEVRRMWT